MKYTLLVPSSLLVLGAAAQPVFNMADIAPPFGPTPVVRSCQYMEPGPTGANFTVDASGLVPGGSSQSQVVTASSTPYVSYFPQATHASTGLTDQTQYAFMQMNSTAGLNWGFYGPASHVVYTNAEKLYQFPLTNGSTWTDAFNGTGDNSGQAFTRSGSTTCSYNGYGTVIMPYGTFTNMARFEIDQTYTDNIAGVLDMITTVHTVGYIKPGLSVSLLTSSEVYSDFGSGEPPTLIGTSTIIVDASEVGISELQGTGPSALLMPNPASNELTVLMDPVAVDGPVSITLQDAVGRDVRVLQPLSAVATAQNFGVSDLPRGLYLMRVADAQGRATSTRLILQ